MEVERWELLSIGEREDRARDAILTFSAIAVHGRDTQRLGIRLDTYPTTKGEWLARTVQLGADAVWQAPSIPLLLMPGGDRYPEIPSHRAGVRTQAAQSALAFGAGLWSALLEWRSAWADDEAIYVAIEAIVEDALEVLDEVREESNGFASALSTAADAAWTYTVYVERGAQPPEDAITAKLTEALGWLAAAVASTDTVLFSGYAEPA